MSETPHLHTVTVTVRQGDKDITYTVADAEIDVAPFVCTGTLRQIAVDHAAPTSKWGRIQRAARLLWQEVTG